MKPEEFINSLKYKDQDLIPTIIQDFENNDVLMLAYMNKESLKKTLECGYTVFWSRSRKCFWKKGETSGNLQKIEEIWYDCDEDTLLIKVTPKGPACHTGERSCFYRKY